MKLKTYSKYKYSGIQWIDKIPEGWEVHRLKFLLETSVTDGPHETPEFISEGIPFLSVDSIQDGKLVFENCRYISEKDHIRFKTKCNPKKNDIFMGKAASIGKIAIANVDFEFSIWSPLALLRPNQTRIIPKVLEYVLKSDYSQDQIDIFATSNTQKNISMVDIPKISLIIPSLSDQTAIANFLDKKIAKIDALIKKDKKLIALLKERHYTLINHAVTKGLDPNAKLKDSGIEWIGEIPEEWEVRKIKHFSRLFTGSTPDSGNEKYWDGNITWVTPADLSVQRKFIKESKRTISHEGYINSGTNFVNVGAIILATRAPIGYPTIVGTKLCFNQGCKAFEIKRDFFLDYVYYFLNAGIDILVSKGNVTTFGELSSYDLISFHVLLPSLSEQTTIVNFLDKATAKIDKTIKLIEKKIKLLEEYKKSLIHHVVTGKVDVRGIES